MAVDMFALQGLLTPTVEALGYELWGCTYMPRGKYGLLRVYIDSTEGIHLTDCERVSRQISAVLDVEDPILNAYTLEVSSPGLDRPLFTAEQFHRYIGAKVQIRLHALVDNRRNLQGILQAVQGNKITIMLENNS
jgi:ribosome maturation factor RimP